ncbi:MAG: hypothetical protein ABFR82_01540 [Nitrospirota bacterium]
MMLRMIIIVFIPFFLFPGGAYPALDDNGGVTAMVKPLIENNKSIPPIDTVIPDKIETATFAMG